LERIYKVVEKNQKEMKRLFLLLSLFLILSLVHGQLKMAGIFTDHAVIQQNAYVPVWGWAKPGAEVVLKIAGRNYTALADGAGRWQISMEPFKADSKTHKLCLYSGKDSICLSNIVFGEVWFASGQSNMEWKMRSGVVNGQQEIAAANYPDIRIHTVKPLTSAQPVTDISGSEWTICTPINAPDFSAVAYFFARELHKDLKVPVGVIVAARGATNLETWMSRERLMTHPDFSESVARFDTDTARWNQKVREAIAAERKREAIANTSTAGIDQKVHTLMFDDTAWSRTEFPLNMPEMGYPGFWGLVWARKVYEMPAKCKSKQWELILPMKNQNDRVYLNGKEIARSVSKMKKPVITIPKSLLRPGRNVIAVRMYVHWGSAEIGNDQSPAYLQSDDGQRIILDGLWTHSNSIEPPVAQWQNYYNTNNVNFNAMVSPVIPYSIRGFLWYQGENNASRFLQYADLQPLLIDDWRVRWQQGYLPFLYVQLANFKERLQTPAATDDWASFRDAQTSTLNRSFNTAMASAIDIGNGNDIHPQNKQDVGKRLWLAAKAKAYGAQIVYSGPVFRSVKKEKDRLRISFDFADNGLKTSDNKPVKGFAVCQGNGQWLWVEARIDTSDILIENIGEVVRIQYAWQSNPEVNLYNAEGLPAVPFNIELK
jgi:sialate O-acetylesterase